MAGNKKQITPGTKQGRWTILHKYIITDSGERKWLCRCDCGTERYVLERSLLYGGSQSCGCLRLEKVSETISHDLTGQIFGELNVLHRAEYQRKNGGIWWTCRCACGNTYDTPATLLVTGRRTHCSSHIHERNYASSDITDQRFSRLVAEYPTEKRDNKGSVIWHCRCDCGNTVDVSYNCLVYSGMKSCGCQKIENNGKLQENLTHADGTSLDIIRSKKMFANNTTGYRGVYLIRGKYVAKIVFQQKSYYLGTYENIEDAANARLEAEETVFAGTVAYYDKWKEAAERNPEWAEKNPMQIEVGRDSKNKLTITVTPTFDEIASIAEKTERNGQ